MKRIVAIATAVSISLLTGCASTKDYANDVEMIKDSRSESVKNYSYLDSKYISDELKLMYFVGDRKVKPINANNLDRYATDYNPHAFSDAMLGGGIGLKLMGGMSWTQLGVFGISNSLSRVDMQPTFARTQVLKLVPIDGLSDEEANERYQKARVDLRQGLVEALGDSGAVFESPDGMWHYVYDANGEGCARPTHIDGDFNRDGCYSAMTPHFDLHRSDAGSVAYAPGSDFLVLRAYLSVGFPVEKLKFNSDNTNLVYVNPWAQTPEFYTRRYDFSEEQWLEMYRTGRFSVIPYLKDLSSGEIHYFNKGLAKQYQSDPQSLIK